MNKQVKEKKLLNNLKAYVLYRGLSYDFLFLLAMEVLFLTHIKGFSLSGVMFLTAFGASASFLLQVPMAMIYSKVGSGRLIKIGPLFLLAAVLIYIFASSYGTFFIASLLRAIGAACVVMASNPMLYNSLRTLKREEEFSKIEGKGVSLFFLLNALAMVVSGFLFDINGYIPIILCAITLVILWIVSLRFSEIEEQKDLKSYSFKDNVNDYKRIINSKFLISVILFAGIIWGLFGIFLQFEKAYLDSIGVSATFIGMIMAGVSLTSFLAARYNYKIQNILGKNDLRFTAIFLLLMLILLGIPYILGAPFILLTIIAIVSQLGRSLIKSPYRIFVKRYLYDGTDKNTISKALALFNMSEAIGRASFAALAGILLQFANIGEAYIYIFVIALIVIVVPLKRVYDNFDKQSIEFEE